MCLITKIIKNTKYFKYIINAVLSGINKSHEWTKTDGYTDNHFIPVKTSWISCYSNNKYFVWPYMYTL